MHHLIPSLLSTHTAVGAATTLNEFIFMIENLPSDKISTELSSSLLIHLRRIASTLVRNSGTLGGNLHMARVKVCMLAIVNQKEALLIVIIVCSI